MNFLKPWPSFFSWRKALLFFSLFFCLKTFAAEESAPTPSPAKKSPPQTYLRIINAVRPELDPVWRSGLDLKMGETFLARDIRSGERGGYQLLAEPLPTGLRIIRNSTGKTLLSQESKFKKDTFNTIILYGSLQEEKHSLKIIFHSAEKAQEQLSGLFILNCIDFFEVDVKTDRGASRSYPLAQWEQISAGEEAQSVLLSFEDEKKRKVRFTQQLILEPNHEHWLILSPNPHRKAFHRPRVLLIDETKARQEAQNNDP
jgi:hypothetical protein